MARKKMSEVKDGGGGYLTEPGKYPMEIIECEEVDTSTGKTQFKIKLNCDEGCLYDRVTMTEKALGFIKRYLSACGYDIDELEYDVDEKTGEVLALFMGDEEWSLDELLLDEDEPNIVMITAIKGDISYKDPTTGETIVRDEDSIMCNIKNIEFIEG